MRCFYVVHDCTDAQKARLREAAGELVCVFADECAPEAREAAFASAEAVLGEPAPESVAQAPNLRWIQMSWAGADRYTGADVPLPAGVRVTCASGAYGGAIAEFIFGVILALYRQLPQYARQQASCLWRPVGGSLGIEGKTVLIVGAGDIGTAFAKRLRPFCPSAVLGIRRTVREKPAEFDEMYGMDRLLPLLGRADITVCCLPNTPETRGLLDAGALRAMKPGSLLVNVGRGSLVDLDALASALASGHLAGAALDVTEPEPLPPEHPLWRMENVLITPHVAGVGFGGVPEIADKIVALCCDNLRRYRAGRPLRSQVDFALGYRRLSQEETK